MRFVAWIKREDKGTCQECFQDAIDQNIPALQRRDVIEKYPCSRHGDPSMLPPRLSAWVEFFLWVMPYCTSQTLDHELVSKICTEYHIPFTQALQKLTWILRAWTKQDETQDKNNRSQGSKGVLQKGD